MWDGEPILVDCLEALYSELRDDADEIICIDNASRDKSAQLIANRFPGVRLIRHSVNLGYAGGINTGIAAARGEVFFLLNQDCVIQSGWRQALAAGLELHSDCGIFGCAIFNLDGSLNHCGAFIRHPDAYGVHQTVAGATTRSAPDYVTGAAWAIRRETWERVGQLDEDFYPAYFEDSDYCYRARYKQIGIMCLDNVRVIHSFSNREWQSDSLKVWANQHAARYRFVSKHFTVDMLREFFDAESMALQKEAFFDQIIARLLAVRDIQRSLSEILVRRWVDLGEDVSPAYRRQLQIGLTEIGRHALVHAFAVSELPFATPNAMMDRAESILQRERDLLSQLQDMTGNENDLTVSRFSRWVRRIRRVLTGVDQRVLTELHALQMERASLTDQFNQDYRKEIERRLKLFELLANYDYR